MTKKDIIQGFKKIIVPILKKNNVVRAGIFGSYARGEQKKSSDVDILVKITRRISLFDFAGIKIELETALGKTVDLVEYTTLKPLLKEKILKEEIRIV
jgi:predicted nucleotidyltransferase